MTATRDHIAILVLAAGGSSRMGRPKALLPWEDTTLLGHVLRQVTAVGSDVFLVLGANAATIQETVELSHVRVIVHDAWAEGLGTSLAYGIRTLQQAPVPYAGALVVLADQPFVRLAYLKAMISEFREGRFPIIASAYPKGRGVPALFSATFFGEMARLKGDTGAKAILARESDRILCVPIGEGHTDIDTPEGYEKWQPKDG